jgi:hypothetical protein
VAFEKRLNIGIEKPGLNQFGLGKSPLAVMFSDQCERESLQGASPRPRSGDPERHTHLISDSTRHHACGRQDKQAIGGHTRTVQGHHPLDEERGLAAAWSPQHYGTLARRCAE